MVVLPFLYIFFLLNVHANVAIEIDQNKLQTYIVQVKQPEVTTLGEANDLGSWYMSFLPETSSESSTSTEQPRLLYSYRNVMCGFAARLTQEQVKAMEEKHGFISATPETVFSLHTTHTPDYLGLNEQYSGAWNESNFGRGVIIGVLDSGIHPTHPSFSDEGMLPPPSKWKGRCEFNNTSLCNNKLIGARTFIVANSLTIGESRSPADQGGHGTHTSSTAAGTFVKDAAALGNAKGTAVGMAPLAHIAMYKVCSANNCTSSDVLAGLDAAVEDGVDVLSISLGTPSTSFFKNNIAIGSFAAIQKGIFVSCSAGNAGPSKSTLANDAPWILTVGASTIDRRIIAIAKLGNGEEYEGQSLFQPSDFPPTLLPLVYAGSKNQTAAICTQDSLIKMDVKGRIVVCEWRSGVNRISEGLAVKNCGGAGMILINQPQDGFTTFSEAHVLPTAHVSHAAGLMIKAYINSSQNPTASISFKGTIIGDNDDHSANSSPIMGSFSSRGPSISSPGILKPDIIGPGINILAAWPFPLHNTTDTRSTFNMVSGTSMSCPHLSGIAALIKSAHPTWSPAAVKSAIMTTADTTNRKGKPILDQDLKPASLFAIGAGHVNPSRAVDPGLVYDIQPEDYVSYLCGLYKDGEVSIIVHKPVVCASVPKLGEGGLNYPSFSVALGAAPQTFKRTVTNVGDEKSIYAAIVEAPVGVSVTVSPTKLIFSRVNQKVTYLVSFRRIGSCCEFGEGYLKWVSGKHVVRSPISVKFS